MRRLLVRRSADGRRHLLVRRPRLPRRRSSRRASSIRAHASATTRPCSSRRRSSSRSSTSRSRRRSSSTASATRRGRTGAASGGSSRARSRFKLVGVGASARSGSSSSRCSRRHRLEVPLAARGRHPARPVARRARRLGALPAQPLRHPLAPPRLVDGAPARRHRGRRALRPRRGDRSACSPRRSSRLRRSASSGWLAFRRFPQAARAPLGEDRREIALVHRRSRASPPASSRCAAASRRCCSAP